MKTIPTALKIAIFVAFGGLSMLGWVTAASGQTLSSGSTGADGAYAPTCTPTPCTVTETLAPSGIYNYTTVTIPAGVTVKYTRNFANTPVTILATGDVTISGTINLSGSNGLAALASGSAVNQGGLGGPGGFNGGNGAVNGGLLATAGQGPGGGSSGNFNTCPIGGSYGAASTFVALLPLFGGSGGGGAYYANNNGPLAVGASGGGGGGALLIGSSTKIVVSGSVVANGGNFGSSSIGSPSHSNGGSGGATLSRRCNE